MFFDASEGRRRREAVIWFIQGDYFKIIPGPLAAVHFLWNTIFAAYVTWNKDTNHTCNDVLLC
jgi:hypothetical protein